MPKNDTSIDDIAESINALATMASDQFIEMKRQFKQIDKRFEQVDKRFEQVDKRFEQVDKRFDQIDQRLGLVEATQIQHTSQLTKIQLSVSKLTEKADDIEGRIEALNNDIKEIYIYMDKHSKELKVSTSTANKTLKKLVVDAYTNVLIIAKEAKVELPRS